MTITLPPYQLSPTRAFSFGASVRDFHQIILSEWLTDGLPYLVVGAIRLPAYLIILLAVALCFLLFFFDISHQHTPTWSQGIGHLYFHKILGFMDHCGAYYYNEK